MGETPDLPSTSESQPTQDQPQEAVRQPGRKLKSKDSGTIFEAVLRPDRPDIVDIYPEGSDPSQSTRSMLAEVLDQQIQQGWWQELSVAPEEPAAESPGEPAEPPAEPTVEPAEPIEPAAEPAAADESEPAEQADDGQQSKAEQDTVNPEKLKAQNIDPRVILALKQKVEEKFQAGGQLDQSTKKVMGIREITRHLLAQGLPVDENGDFMPEGMQLLHDMSTMMDMSDWALGQLKSDKFGDEPPLVVEPNDQALKDLIKKRNEENLKNLPKNDKKSGDGNGAAEKESPSNTIERLEFIGRLIVHRAYAKVGWVKRDIDKVINRGHQYLDSTLDKVIESLNSDDINKRRRGLLGWTAGAFATAGSAYAGVDHELLSSPSLAQGGNETSDFFQPAQPPEAEKPPLPEVKIDEATRNLLGRAGILSSDEFLSQENGRKYRIVESDPHYEHSPGLIILKDDTDHVVPTDYNSLMAQLKSGNLTIGRVRQVGPLPSGLS
jgi:hypothetical protein